MFQIFTQVSGISFAYLGKPKDDGNDDDNVDDDDNGMKIEQPMRKTSDEYRLEIAMIESEKEKLMKEFEKYKIEIPKLADINNKLVVRLENAGGN